MRKDTVVVSGGRPAHEHDAPVNPSVVLTSTYRGAGDLNDRDRTYARFTNPTWEAFEEVLANLEEAPVPALSYASGMAAVASVLTLVPVGGTLVMPQHCYQGTLQLAHRLEDRGIFSVRTVDVEDTEATIAAIQGADVLWLESPTNPMLEVADLPAVLAAAREAGVLSCVDNTFATPLLQRPLTLGADLVVHSVTKYLAGHSDVVLGAVVCSTPELRANLKKQRSLEGAIPGPFEAWLALRGVRTLSVRLERSMASAAELARRLGDHPAVAEVSARSSRSSHTPTSPRPRRSWRACVCGPQPRPWEASNPWWSGVVVITTNRTPCRTLCCGCPWELRTWMTCGRT